MAREIPGQAMPEVRWDYTSAWMEDEIQHLLRNGWEPFAATISGIITTVHFKKLVRR